MLVFCLDLCTINILFLYACREPAGGDMQSSYKPRGFGRGKPLAQNVDDGSDKQQRNGFGSRPAGGFGKAQGGFGSRTSNGTGGEKDSFGGAFANSSTSRGKIILTSVPKLHSIYCLNLI